NQAIGIDRRTIQLEQTDIQCRAAEESLADHQLSRNNVSISRNRNITSVETGSSACVASVGGVVNSTRRETLGIHVNFDLLNSTHRRQGAAPIATALLGNPVTTVTDNNTRGIHPAHINYSAKLVEVAGFDRIVTRFSGR